MVNIQPSSRSKIFLILALLTLLVRLPFFFPDVIDSDESTFILFGQDIVDGNLPYENLWDVKPPLLFFCFALLILTFGKTILAIRIGGAVCILVAAYLVYLSGEKTRNSRTGLIAAAFLIIFSTLSESGGGTTSEIIAIVPLTGAALFFLKSELRARDVFFAGILISAACMIRLNLVYLALAGGVFLLIGRLFNSPDGPVRRLAVYAGGGAIPVVLSFLPYLFAGKSHLYFVTMFSAPLNYSSSQLSLLEAVSRHAARLGDPGYFLQNALLWVGFLCGLLYIFMAWKRTATKTRAHVGVLIFFLLATFLSIIKTGEAYEHYIVQALPFVCLIAAFFIDYLLTTRTRNLFIAAVIVLLIAPASTLFGAYEPVVLRAMSGKRLAYGPTYDLADYLRKANPGREPVLLMSGHLVHWFQNTKPSRFVVHPSNIGKEYLLKAVLGSSATVESELAKILENKPAFVVKTPVMSYLNRHPVALSLLEETLFMDYELTHIIDSFLIYKRIEPEVLNASDVQRLSDAQRSVER